MRIITTPIPAIPDDFDGPDPKDVAEDLIKECLCVDSKFQLPISLEMILMKMQLGYQSVFFSDDTDGIITKMDNRITIIPNAKLGRKKMRFVTALGIGTYMYNLKYNPDYCNNIDEKLNIESFRVTDYNSQRRWIVKFAQYLLMPQPCCFDLWAKDESIETISDYFIAPKFWVMCHFASQGLA